MRNATLLALLVCASAVGGCLHRPPPPAPDQPSGLRSEIGPRLNNWSQATVPADGLIVVSGDDFVKPGVTPLDSRRARDRRRSTLRRFWPGTSR